MASATPPVLAYVRSTALGEPPHSWHTCLPPTHRERLRKMRSDRARRQTEAGLRLLATLTSRNALATLTEDRAGRPFLPEGPAFSISHSGDYCVALVATAQPVGIDLERLRAIRNNRILRFLGTDERAAAAHDRSAFFHAWTAREAAIKATGKVGPKRLAQVRMSADCAWIDGQRLQLQRPAFESGYALCVASAAALPPLVPQDLTESVRKNSAP